MESKILSFAQKMEELLEIERQEEMEESANLLTKFSLKVTQLTFNQGFSTNL
jgi:hypothetical protein